MRRAALLMIVGLVLMACASADQTKATTPDLSSAETTVPAETTTVSPATTAPGATSTSGTSSTTTTAATDTTEAETTTTSAPTATTRPPTTTVTTTTTTSASTTSTTATGQTVTVSLENFAIVPAAITIKVGDTVRWVVGSGTHTSTSSEGVWNSGSLGVGDEFSWTFTEQGTYRLFCSFHPDSMAATITVES